ncbi:MULTISPECIES: DUF1259 domain-containing protein [Streptomycetaceae]|uniref:Lipoprotein n=1 Tax=Streptantibioticus cattleyicolor (strain ATCC 35852 / DSM 46488 / JCM 4925 / NBRC 14057 / NRRL 8057) TaxID=1003195 RepID=F8JXR7_STREN|nr:MULTISPECIES: DUF1259 domain-containing protein [Streptomycetaceae]AEW97173.1 lipoprotein [Streptantibioticus cattleyicolor NRRL 8057 = DSM 46488]MYS61630.1 DUF1259 domain-containing protein [Streptomyces sp. SID5468]CCB77496.1 conserved exported protein of unknown function [Streptantibioticus cattleyicolor NRRL 8057 = DSM 46488]
MPAFSFGAAKGRCLRVVLAATVCAAAMTTAPATASSSHRHRSAHARVRLTGRHAVAGRRRTCSRVQRPEETTEADWAPVAQALGRHGVLRDKVTFGVLLPRGDLNVTTHGVTVVAPLALAGSAAFVRYCDGTMLMGDLVLTADEVDRTVDALHAAGIEMTALHKHLAEENPPTWWVHFHAMGDPVALARGLKQVLAVTATPAAVPHRQDPARPLELDTAAIDRELGRKGTVAGSVYVVFVDRRRPVVMHGHVLPGSTGCNTALMFQSLGKDQAAVNGDLILTADEVQPAAHALRAHGIRLVELHNHMLDERPHVFFLHFWATGNATDLARALRAALDTTRLAPPTGARPAHHV